jgi:hypothetical protein
MELWKYSETHRYLVKMKNYVEWDLKYGEYVPMSKFDSYDLLPRVKKEISNGIPG